ncbi:hypothetical protein [Streptomyces hyaluromycini]|uniref:hypothetical protein n=1 Tax=Streptomyces hyaluromycini TaxID=1377993 RepID=UPI000B5CE641|nr:hypothetical protein [Streptomyces hyaluromycini]
MTPIVRSGAAARAESVPILLGPLVSRDAEFVTAEARQGPPSSPVHNRVGRSGLTGPAQTAFGQGADSTLGTVTDTGWVSYGILLLIVGAFLLFDPRKGTRPIVVVSLAVLAGVGNGLIAFPLFMANAFTGRMGNNGIFERAVVYPFMIGHALLGSRVAAARRRHATRPPTPFHIRVAS